MEIAEHATRPDRGTSRRARRARGLVAPVAALLAIGVLGGVWFWPSRPSPIDEARAAASRGRDYLRLGRPDLAFQAVSRVRDESPEAGEAMTVAGLALIRMGQYRVARMALERAVELKPDQFEAAVTLGELHLDLGSARRGADVLEMAARLRPREFGVWLVLGRALDNLNDTAGAAQAYQKALELRPTDHGVMIELIALLINSGQSGPAEPWIARALRASPDDPVVLGLAARGASLASRIDESLTLADRALQRDPGNPDASLARVQCLVARSQWAEASAAAELALATTPEDVSMLRLLRIAQTRIGLTERAAVTQARLDRAQRRTRLMVELTEQLNWHPDDPAIRWKMGQVALEAGSIRVAHRCFEASLALDPDYQPARESLAALKAAHPELHRSPSASALPRRPAPSPRAPFR
jgi:tetratricopeptide (TPR) repeat protein